MAAVTVAWDAASFGRIDAAESTTNWWATGSGASPTVETDYYYQGSSCISIQVKTSVYTLRYVAASSTDMNTTPRVVLYKVIQTNKNAIDGSGLRLRIGSSNSDYSSYDIFNSNTYPTLGGFVVVPIQPSITQWITSNTGTPNHAAATVWTVESDAAFTAKAPNLGLDSIDVMDVGTGLTVTRGDGADANASFQSFVDSDEGTSTNRWGIVQTRDNILYVSGVLSIGNTTVNTEFTDSNKVLVFPDARVSNGFCGVDMDASNTGSTTTINSCVFNGIGDLYTNDDTRPDYTVTGTAGTIDITSCTFDNFREMSTTSAVTMDACVFLNGLNIIQNGANIYSASVISPTNLINTGFITSDDPGKLDNLTIAMGSGGGHAAEITTAGTYTLTGHTYTGYATTNGQSNSVFYNNSGGLVTLNIVNGDSPTIRNGTSASTVVNQNVNITLTGIETESEIRVYPSNPTPAQGIQELVTGQESSNGTVQDATIVSGGTSYAVSDVLTVSGGTGTAATLTVDAVSGGVITEVSVTTAGDYSVNPTNPVSVTGGTGTGATFNLDISGEFTFSAAASTLIDVIIFHQEFKEVRLDNFTVPVADSSIPISQIVDRVYNNP